MSNDTLHIGLLTIDIFIPMSNSLKTKRGIIKSIKDRVKNKFNVSVAEFGQRQNECSSFWNPIFFSTNFEHPPIQECNCFALGILQSHEVSWESVLIIKTDRAIDV